MNEKTARRDGHAIAWLAFVLGTLASVAANIAHARIVSHGIGPQIAAAFWPLALLASIEIITRVQWPNGWLWLLARFGGAGIVGACAAVLSYSHMSGLLASFGEDTVSAHIGPFVVDGMMIIAGTALLALSRKPAPVIAETPQVETQPVSVTEPAPVLVEAPVPVSVPAPVVAAAATAPVTPVQTALAVDVTPVSVSKPELSPEARTKQTGKDMIKDLITRGQAVNAVTLAQRFGVTDRTIRNWTNEIRTELETASRPVLSAVR